MEPTPLATAATVRDAVLPVRAASLALRLLSGAGKPSIHGYGSGPSRTCETVWHGLTARGALLVAAIDTFDNPLTGAPALEPISVRLDVVKESPEWAARITACAIHLLGTLQWLPQDDAGGYLDASVNPLVAEAAAMPGGRLGVLRTDRVVLHDSAGVAPMPFADVLASRSPAGAFPSAVEELSAREELERLTQSDLAELFALADDGWDGALPLTSHAVETCASLHGQVLCVDIDRTGLTLMQVDAAGTRTALFAFDQPAGSLSELSGRVGGLAARVGLRRLRS